MESVTSFLLVGALIAAIAVYRRRRIINLEWPKTQSFLRMQTLCEKYLHSRGWSIQYRFEIPIVADLLVKKRQLEFLVFLRPHGSVIGIDFLQRAERVKVKSGMNVVVICIDFPPMITESTGSPDGVHIIHYKCLRCLEGIVAASHGPDLVKTDTQCWNSIMGYCLFGSIGRFLPCGGRSKAASEELCGHYQKIRTKATGGADFVFEPSEGMMVFRRLFPEFGQCVISTDHDGVVYLRLAGSPVDAVPEGHTGGFSLQVPDSFEHTASGKGILIRIIARAGAQADVARFALAYSTNEVGNSGWRWFEAQRQWSLFETFYSVPPMKAGNGDFIGILPAGAGFPAIDISCVAALVFGRSEDNVSSPRERDYSTDR